MRRQLEALPAEVPVAGTAFYLHVIAGVLEVLMVLLYGVKCAPAIIAGAGAETGGGQVSVEVGEGVVCDFGSLILLLRQIPRVTVYIPTTLLERTRHRQHHVLLVKVHIEALFRGCLLLREVVMVLLLLLVRGRLLLVGVIEGAGAEEGVSVGVRELIGHPTLNYICWRAPQLLLAHRTVQKDI